MKKGKAKTFFKRFWDAFWRPEMLVLPGQIAFFIFLSIVPTITIIGYICSYLNISNESIEILLSRGFGSSFSELLTPMITNVSISPAFLITLGVGYFIASNGPSSIIVASNTIYGIKDSGFFNRRLKAIIMELIIVVLLIFIVLVPLLGDSIINILHYFNLSATATSNTIKVLNFLSGPFSWIFIFLFIKIIYTMAPDRKIPSKNVNGGAIFTTIGWILSTKIYAIYIERYANYSIFYGALANIIILMLWIYLLSYIFVIGMAMNYHEELEKTGIMEVREAIQKAANNSIINQEPENDAAKEDASEKVVKTKKETKSKIKQK